MKGGWLILAVYSSRWSSCSSHFESIFLPLFLLLHVHFLPLLVLLHLKNIGNLRTSPHHQTSLHEMDPAYRGYMNILNQGSSSQHSESSRQDSPPQIPSTFPQAQPTHSSQSLSPNFHNFHPFGHPTNYPVYGNSPPGFLGFQHQGNWPQSTPMSYQGKRRRRRRRRGSGAGG